jgi:ATP phosphoribosyltransferase
MRDRLRLAIPNKGRLVEPTLALLHDAGLMFEEHDRSLVAHVQNHPLDVLFVRTGDVIEFVNDGVADAGITGGDILAESGTPLPILCNLGYGRCRLAAAAPSDAPYETIADLAGARVATSHPNVTRRFFADQSISGPSATSSPRRPSSSPARSPPPSAPGSSRASSRCWAPSWRREAAST